MNKRTKCADALKDVRRNMQNDADPCILAALDEAIGHMERCEARDDPNETMKAAVHGLAVVSDILTCVTGIAELVKLLGR
jgi:hypothetical protein